MSKGRDLGGRALWQRLRSDEHAVMYLLFAIGIVAWLLVTGGMNSTPAWIALAVNSALWLLALYLGLRVYRRMQHGNAEPGGPVHRP